jgi:hypothetical protein
VPGLSVRKVSEALLPILGRPEVGRIGWCRILDFCNNEGEP